MTERKEELKTYRIDYVCNNCGKDYMKPTGPALLTRPPKFKHVCLTCGHVEIFNEKYPKIVYEEGI